MNLASASGVLRLLRWARGVRDVRGWLLAHGWQVAMNGYESAITGDEVGGTASTEGRPVSLN